METNYYLESRENSKGLNRIFIYLRIGRPAQTIKIAIPHKVPKQYWDSSKQKVKRAYTGSVELNMFLSDTTTKVKNKLIDLHTSGHLNKATATDAIREILGQTQPKGFFDVYDKFTDYKKEVENVAENTLKKFHTLKAHLKGFEAHSKQKLSFESFNLNTFLKFRNYLSTKKNTSAHRLTDTGMTKDSFAKYASSLKQFIKWARSNGYHNSTHETDFKAQKSMKVDNVILTPAEIKKIKDLDLSKAPQMDKVRDFMMFGIYTAQRWSDLSTFDQSNFDHKNKVWRFLQKKGGKEVSIPFEGFAATALEILEKHDYKLPKFSNQYFNRELKKLCAMAGLNDKVKTTREINGKIEFIETTKAEAITAHTLRRSAITYLVQKLPLPTVMMLTGHTKLETIMKYINTSLDDYFKSMEGVKLE